MHYVESLEFVAEDDTAFAQWTSVLASAIRYKISMHYNIIDVVLCRIVIILMLKYGMPVTINSCILCGVAAQPM